MATITSISPLMATRGASGTLITLAGSGFGAAQAGGTLTIGGVAAIVASWGASAITCRADDSPATPLGAQDVVVTPDGGSPVTAAGGIYVYDAADAKDAAEVDLGIVDAVYLDGEHVGFTSRALDIIMR